MPSLTPRDLQSLLAISADGLWGPNTMDAIRAWFTTGRDLLASAPGPGAQKTSARGIEDLVFSEGLRTNAYRDSVGVWTIGVGHTASAGPPAPKAGMTITQQEALDLLARDLANFEKTVRTVLGPVPQHVFDGAVSFHFNTGGIGRASWVDKYKAGDMTGARAAFMSWRKPPEIIGRRTREAALIFDGKYR